MKKTTHSFGAFKELTDSFDKEMSLFKKFLKRQASAFKPELRKQASESIRPEGKFLRPLLVFAAAYGHKDSESLNRRAAIAELIHLSTLIHDDVIDNASLRRGNETIFKKYGARFAILLGDAIFAHTMRLVFEENDTNLSKKATECVRTICEGEIMQTLANKDINISQEKYFSIVNGKTAVLFELSCHMGAALTQDATWVSCAQEVGKQLGIAYQIFDDICDWTKSEKQSGKTIGTDLLSGKQTYPLILLFEKLSKTEVKLLTKSIKNSQADAQQILKSMQKHDIFKLCADEFLHRVSMAEDSLKPFGRKAEKLLAFCGSMRALLKSI